jgi:hypothetical protein
MQNIQEFSIKQGVVGSQTGLISGFVWEFSGNGGRSVAGLEEFQTRKNEFLRGDNERLRSDWERHYSGGKFV